MLRAGLIASCYHPDMGRFPAARADQLIRRARLDADLTQAELARRAGIQQASIAQIEAGTRQVSDQMLERLLRAADYRPSLPLTAAAAQITALAHSRRLSNVRVFGSATRGEDGFDSDIDLLVTPSTDTDLFDIALFAEEVSQLTGFPVDVVADTSASDLVRNALSEAVPL